MFDRTVFETSIQQLHIDALYATEDQLEDLKKRAPNPLLVDTKLSIVRAEIVRRGKVVHVRKASI